MKKDKFLTAIDTLKLYRRAELVNEQGKQLITKLYVDPLPNEHLLHTVLKPNTTFLVGRKGTGKSTIFQRAQETLNSEKKSTWAYIDIKSLYESSTSELVGGIPPEFEAALSPETIQKICVFKRFTIDLIKEIKSQIKIRVNSSLLSQVKEVFTGSATELFEKLDEFIQELEAEQYLDVTREVGDVLQIISYLRQVFSRDSVVGLGGGPRQQMGL
jgi:Cdc6-like AAA superfamily ATPase